MYVIVNSQKGKGKTLKHHILKDFVPRGFDARIEEIQEKHQQAVNGGHVLQRKLKEKIIINKYDLKWKETSEKCKWEHRTR